MLDQLAVEQMKITLDKAINNKEIAGGNLMIMKAGKEIFYHDSGLADRERGLPMKRETIFRLYSMTKPVTAVAIMILLERGVIDLFEPVSQFLPGFKNQLVEDGNQLVLAEREVNIYDLLSMTSGLVYGGDTKAGQETESLFQEIDQHLYSESPLGTVDIINRLGQFPLAFQPGSSWQYGTSADVLGAVVEVVSGMRFGEFLQKELFQPLDMRDTGFWLPKEKSERLAKTYADNGQGDLILYNGDHLGIHHQMDRDPAFESGGAGLVSTIDDYAKFATMLLNKGTLDGVEILRPRTVDYFTSTTLHNIAQKQFDLWHTLQGYSYGNLMRIMTNDSQTGVMGSLSEYGWDGWLGAYFCNCPKDQLTFLFMIQKKDAGTMPLTRKLRNIALSSLSTHSTF
ncbi:beta-lactamase [Virgibacillus soli]|uniref:serine hydrolase domain-containing protein n=1 Tax=Lederbergia galactosidilytica TaxID=217031 RepID=UPI000712648E|nr:serine hydrolase domain-containing protein [Lederbergia galactosidilytica]KRG11073.1 beta-lactamase [Virgibacillus soli]MBP1916563.1 CubicO group peptidase (beta-lactamase class C family) [Lederbergia galactosidilytica]